MTQQEIHNIYSALSDRYDRISVSTIKGLLKGRIKVKNEYAKIVDDKQTTPKLNEVETAFLTHNCAILTAFRGAYNLKENLGRNICLKDDMDALGLKYKPVRGCYREADQEYVNIEYCFFIYTDSNVEDFFASIYALSEKYEQDSFLYKRAGINRTAFLIATNDAGRAEFDGDIKFAGQLFLHVPNVEAWTDCSDGRFAFQLKGIILTDTQNQKIRLGEGNIFDTGSYLADGLVIIRRVDQKYYAEEIKRLGTDFPMAQHVFRDDVVSAEYFHEIVSGCLRVMKEKHCRRIGILCSVKLNESAQTASASVFETVQSWTKRNAKSIELVVINDPHGHYANILKSV